MRSETNAYGKQRQTYSLQMLRSHRLALCLQRRSASNDTVAAHIPASANGQFNIQMAGTLA